jgi:hypothetical protein
MDEFLSTGEIYGFRRIGERYETHPAGIFFNWEIWGNRRNA